MLLALLELSLMKSRNRLSGVWSFALGGYVGLQLYTSFCTLSIVTSQ